jgi:hypothetical protein
MLLVLLIVLNKIIVLGD